LPSINCIGYQNINSKYRIHSDHTFKEQTDWQTEGLCPDCRQKLRELWLSEVIESRFHDMSFDSFNQEKNKPLFTKVLKYSQNSNKNSLILWGKRCGTGKTHLAISIARSYIENIPMSAFSYPPTNPVAFTTEPELLNEIRSGYDKNGNSEHQIIDKLTNSRLLIYDDVGKVTPANLDFLQRISFLLIDRLYRKQKRLIMTSNLGMAELSLHLGEAVVSRLHEMCGKDNIIEVKGLDYRIT